MNSKHEISLSFVGRFDAEFKCMIHEKMVKMKLIKHSKPQNMNSKHEISLSFVGRFDAEFKFMIH